MFRAGNYTGKNTFHVSGKVIHGASFAVMLNEVEFLTWKKNDDTGDYWVKFHTPSSKEIRIKVGLEHLNFILGEWAITKGNDVYPNVNGDDDELGNQE
tara:strand:- start:543 stop:836 length:294 start_codon:yes stop_codon:yes gene_type:complete